VLSATIEDYKRKIQDINKSDLRVVNRDLKSDYLDIKETESNASSTSSVRRRRSKRGYNDYGSLKSSMNIKDSVLKKEGNVFKNTNHSRSQLKYNGSVTSSHKLSNKQKIDRSEQISTMNLNAQTIE
jgi:hypothetical protein